MNKYLVEFLGTLVLTFVVLSTTDYLAIGAVLAIVFALGGPISGGAFNPAIALSMMASRKLSSNDVIPYILAEIAGALFAIELIKVQHKI